MTRRSPGFTRRFALVLAMLACGFSLPASACMCGCSMLSPADGNAAAGVTADQFDKVFSDIVVWTERIPKPLRPEDLGKEFVESPGYWFKSRVLVLRIWQGAPPMVAEVWTPVVTSCDVQPVPGFHFIALVLSEGGRDVANNTYCDCDLKAAATKGRGTFAAAGVSIVAAVAIVAFLALLKFVRRRRAGRITDGPH